MAELILALDLPDGATALRLLDSLPTVKWVKVGSYLMTRSGPDLVDRLSDRGLSVFLDLKWHDIPHTVAGAVTAARESGVRLVTVHTLGGMEMMNAAAEASGPGLAVVGVTVLTSHTAASYTRAIGRTDDLDLGAEVVRQGRNAIEAGLDGVVVSSAEVTPLREALGARPFIVVPGIRLPGGATDDQSRVAGPATAIAAGASHLVIGRAVLRAPDPAAAWAMVEAEAT
jgi:orotidine-5'-phosphate decarboxylase